MQQGFGTPVVRSPVVRRLLPEPCNGGSEPLLHAILNSSVRKQSVVQTDRAASLAVESAVN